jgi:glycerol uptake facilitator-like aquaporin
MNSRNTENKLFTTLFATFTFLMLASLTTKDAHTQNYQQPIKQELQLVTPNISTSEINPKIATVYVVGKRLPKAAL